MTSRFALTVAALSASTALSIPQPAFACGGCFAPSGTASQVTAHRMAVLVSADSTTLWDQFEYAGAPEDFVWVLPVKGTDVVIEEASNNFFTALSASTAIQLQAPFRSSGGGGGGFGLGCASDASSAESSPSSRVMVYGEEVVGPYETVTIGSEDPEALVSWLQDRGYGVPDTIRPAIAYYVERQMSFVALRLSPGEGIQRMQPVRVTTPGVNLSFPLRMVGAGVTDSVALELFILGEGRYQAANFDNLEVDRSAIVYDYATATFDYDARAQALVDESLGGGWLTEVAMELYSSQLESVYTDDGQLLDARDDARFVQERLGQERIYVTRMRSELPLAALRVDLVLEVSTGGDLYNFIQVENDINAPAGTSAGLAEAGIDPSGWLIVLALGGLVLRRRN